jgi:ATP-dependent Clp protease ATP-binding subunit ClpB
LTKSDIRKIVQIQFRILEEILAKQEIELSVTKEAMDFIVEKGYDPEFGARPIKRVMHKKVLQELSKALLKGTIKAQSRVILDSFGESLIFRNPRDRELEKLVTSLN